MRKLGIYVVMAIFAGVVSGCLDDDNNYNYTPCIYKQLLLNTL